MEIGRTFVTTVFTSSMTERIKSMDCLLDIYDLSEQGVLALIGVDFISALKDQQVVDLLQKSGVENAKVNPIKVILMPGDTLYVVNPDVSREDRKNNNIPEHITITVTKYKVKKKEAFVKEYLEKKLG